jgi:hypothetical protein
MDLHLADLVGVSGRDAAARRATRLLAERMDTVVFPSEVEDAVSDVTDHATFINQQSAENGDTNFFQRECFPESFTWISDNAGAKCQTGHIVFGDASRQEVEFKSGHCVTRIRTSVDFKDSADGIFTSGKFL